MSIEGSPRFRTRLQAAEMKTCLLLFVFAFTSFTFSDDGGTKQSNTKVVVLGTGTPSADPERSGPSVAVVVNNHAYLVDCGPGVVRRAAAAEKNGFEALKPTELKIAFPLTCTPTTRWAIQI